MISLAKEYALPLIIHSREAVDRTIEILQGKAGQHPTVIHCFTGTIFQAQRWLSGGGLLSFTGIITYKNNSTLREVVRAVPLDKIMLETDAPYLAPEGFRNLVGEPKYVEQVARCIAEVKGISLEEVATVTTETAERFFDISG